MGIALVLGVALALALGRWSRAVVVGTVRFDVASSLLRDVVTRCEWARYAELARA